MRTLTRILATVGLALTVGSTANADVTISLVQIGGTYSASVGANPGDTLVLAIDYSVTNGPNLTGITSIDPSLQFDLTVASLTGGVETGVATFTDPTPTTYSTTISMSPIVQTSDIQTQPTSGTNVADGWEKTTLAAGGAIAPCSATPAIFCSRLGNATFTLTGVGGVIDTGGVIGPLPFGTVVLDGTFTNVATGPGVSLGTFTINAIPEPTTASLLGLGLVGLTVAGRRRKN
jgi:hypothetical protein